MTNYENKSLKELDEIGFYGLHNIIINKLRNGVYDSPEDVLKDIQMAHLDENAKSYVLAYTKAVFGI